MSSDNSSQTKKRITRSIVICVILCICLCMTSFALVLSIVEKDNNIFATGRVKINLNDGKPVITEEEFLFEPGMTVVKDFFIESSSTWSVYYKLYFANVHGGLADILQVTITDKDSGKIVYSGTPKSLNRQAVPVVDDILEEGGRRDFKIIFHYPEDGDNSGQGKDLSFDLCADAVQTKNNPNKEFE